MGNVVAVGNSVGFVEPLEATALQIICVQISSLADSLIDCVCEPTPTLIGHYNRFSAQAWDDIRDFLAVHYAFNTRLDTPFWVACRNDTQLHGAQPLVDFYRENGPSVVYGPQLLHSSNSFGMDGYLTLLLGQNVPHAKPYHCPPKEGDCDAIARPNGITTHSADSPLKNRSLPFGNTASKSGVPCNPRIRENGGAEGIRTPDPHNAIVVLYQLSYDPDRPKLVHFDSRPDRGCQRGIRWRDNNPWLHQARPEHCGIG